MSPILMKISRLFLAMMASLSLLACGTPDTRSFEIENILFEHLRDGVPANLREQPLDAARQAQIAAGLSAICQGQTTEAGKLLDEAAIGRQIYRLVLIASKANRKGACDYGDWPEKLSLLGERFKQLVGSGDAPSVLLAALLDEQLPAAEQQAVVLALAGRGYGHAQVYQAAAMLSGKLSAADSEKALALLEQAARQGAVPAHLVRAWIYHEGLGLAADQAKACASLREAAKLGSMLAPERLRLEACPAV